MKVGNSTWPHEANSFLTYCMLDWQVLGKNVVVVTKDVVDEGFCDDGWSEYCIVKCLMWHFVDVAIL